MSMLTFLEYLTLTEQVDFSTAQWHDSSVRGTNPHSHG